MKMKDKNILCGMMSCTYVISVFIVLVVWAKFITTEFSSDHIESTQYPILIPPIEHFTPEYLTLQNESLIDWENGFKKCGNPVEGCPDDDEVVARRKRNDLLESNSTASIPSRMDFKRFPSLCRCDENCTKFGDCCASVLAQIRQIPMDNLWRCRKLLDSSYAVRMISKCPPEYPDGLNKSLCENEDHTCPINNGRLCPYLDIPKYSNDGNLYKNIFCARCHSHSNHEIIDLQHELYCSDFESRSEWEEFSKRAIYQRGKLTWKDSRENSSLQCRLHFDQLQPDKIEETIPDIRFCDEEFKEDCPLDLSIEENLVTYHLCHSYVLSIIIRRKNSPNPNTYFKYKNPDCAKCINPNINKKRDPQCFRVPPRGRIDTMLTRMIPATGDSGPVGINVLFHFSLHMDEGYVGFNSKCKEDEIMDFIRHKCVPVICQTGFQLEDGQCTKIQQVPESNTSDSQQSDDPQMTNTTEPCFLILFHDGQYQQLENGSLAINTDESGVVIFQPGEYQRYEGDGNNKSMSICAKNIENTYERSFTSDLGYISNILLGVSVHCLAAHIVLYIILPKMRNLPGNNLLCLVVCLLLSHLIFLLFINSRNSTLCVAASISMHYFLLSSFIWMYVMSFDIWRTFSSQFIIRRYSGDSTRTFIKYSMCAWILPLVIVIIAMVIDFGLPSSWLTDPEWGPILKKLRPMYGHNGLCWIGQQLSLFVFFAFPVALIIFCNIMLFGLTAWTIWAQNNEGKQFINGIPPQKTKSLNGTTGKLPLQNQLSSSTKKSDHIRFKLYAKLALIMGLTWILGILSVLLWDWLWYPFVVFNALQGAFIFIAFDCKRKVWNMVKEACCSKRKQKRDPEGSSETTSRRLTATISSSLSTYSSKTRISKDSINETKNAEMSSLTA